MERYRVFLHIQSECWKMWTRITPNTDTFSRSGKYIQIYRHAQLRKKKKLVYVKLKEIYFFCSKVETNRFKHILIISSNIFDHIYSITYLEQVQTYHIKNLLSKAIEMKICEKSMKKKSIQKISTLI